MQKFWDFSVRTYRVTGVADACLSLQNDHDVDVNMLLFCAWVGAAIGEFDGELFNQANEFSNQWAENVVIPLREARTWMKHQGCHTEPMPSEECMALREEIKSIELGSEKLQQQVLESLVTVDDEPPVSPESVIGNVRANLMLYLVSLDIEPVGDIVEKLITIVAAAFPDIDSKLVAAAFDA
ncbi:MAG: TIGR02444 family protein [Woeseiaceae bacterium]|nr:TIGR02444 family protein [Woeseiaceae bacterium]